MAAAEAAASAQAAVTAVAAVTVAVAAVAAVAKAVGAAVQTAAVGHLSSRAVVSSAPAAAEVGAGNQLLLLMSFC